MKRIDRQNMVDLLGLSKMAVHSMVENEFRQMRDEHHPHIVKLFEFLQDSRYSYFVMEVANGGDLRSLVQSTYHSSRKKP
jgi:serine/threonine protein kinase